MAQCSTSEVKGISYYTRQDVTLGQFLEDSCFRRELKCVNPQCKKGVGEHTLTFVHKGGRLDVGVETLSGVDLAEDEEEVRHKDRVTLVKIMNHANSLLLLIRLS